MKISYILPITEDAGVKTINSYDALRHLGETLESVIAQSVPNWELIVVVQKKLLNDVLQIWGKVVAKNSKTRSLDKPESYPSVRFMVTKTKNSAKACNMGLKCSKGKFVAAIQAGDKLAENTTYEFIMWLIENQKTQFIYTDHDYLDQQSNRFKPFFKPSLSPDLLYCQNYIGNFVLLKKSLLIKLQGWNEKYCSAYGYELNLKAISNLLKLDQPNPKLHNNQSPIQHIRKILYHNRTNLKKPTKNFRTLSSRSSPTDEAKQSKQELMLVNSFFKSCGRHAKARQIKPKLRQSAWSPPKPEPLVSLIIPTRDGYEILRNCIQSILKKTTYKNYEILIIDNQSTNIKSINYMESLAKDHSNIHLLKYPKPFNYSAINNFAVAMANGSLIGLINNDTEIITQEWLTEMVSNAIRPEIGCVGAMLYYPDRTIQHAGVTIGMNGVAGHAFTGLINSAENDYFNYLISQRNPKAVTAAVMVLRKKLFTDANKFDAKNLPIAFNDVDLCLKILSKGFQNLWLPQCEIFHHESKTRGSSTALSRQDKKEHLFIKQKWLLNDRFLDVIKTKDHTINPLYIA